MGCTACTEPQCLYKGALYLYLYSPYGLYGLYRASVPVQRYTLPLTLLLMWQYLSSFSRTGSHDARGSLLDNVLVMYNVLISCSCRHLIYIYIYIMFIVWTLYDCALSGYYKFIVVSWHPEGQITSAERNELPDLLLLKSKLWDKRTTWINE